MDKVSEILSSKLNDAIVNYRMWGEMYYNVQNYGVLPGGVDVTAALQALVNKATVESRTAIFFPPGDYKVTAISNDSAVFYVGDNARFVGGYTKVINLIGTNPGPYGGPPNAHAATHVTGGADVIPNAVAGGISGLMSGDDKTKLNGVATGANNYVHPSTHPPSIITQDASNRFVSDGEKTTWNAKANQSDLTTHTSNTVIHVTQTDRDRWDAGGGGGTAGPSFGKVNDIQSVTANDTITFAAGTGMAVSTDPATKTVTYTAQGSSAPGSHASTHITGGSDVIPNVVAGGNSGLMSGSDKTKLDGVATGANNYTHPATHPPSIIAQDANNRFVTDTQITQWNSGGSGVTIGTTAAVTYYVDGTAGNDTTGTGTQALPFKTIQKAVDTLWNLCKGKINHNCNILLKDSITYPESIVVSGFWGLGYLTIRGNYTNSGAKATISNLTVYSCSSGGFFVKDLTATSSNTAFAVVTSTGVEISSCQVITSAGSPGIASSYSVVSVFSCVISNRSSAILSNYSTIVSNGNTGTGNTNGLVASTASTIAKVGTQPAAATAEVQNTGGVIRA